MELRVSDILRRRLDRPGHVLWHFAGLGRPSRTKTYRADPHRRGAGAPRLGGWATRRDLLQLRHNIGHICQPGVAVNDMNSYDLY
jgi:hypothetical protein